jgi:hypothetical protein
MPSLVTLEDILGASKGNEDIYTRFGQSGVNNAGTWNKRLLQVMGPTLASQAVYAQQLEPQRQAVIDAYIASLQPQNINATADADRARLMSSGAEQGIEDAHMVRGAGLGEGAQAGAMFAARNNAVRAGNANLFALSSPMGREAAMRAAIGGIQAGQSMPGMSPFMASAGFTEDRNRYQDAKEAAGKSGGFGDIVGSLAGLASSVPWAGMKGGWQRNAKTAAGGWNA